MDLTATARSGALSNTAITHSQDSSQTSQLSANHMRMLTDALDATGRAFDGVLRDLPCCRDRFLLLSQVWLNLSSLQAELESPRRRL